MSAALRWSFVVVGIAQLLSAAFGPMLPGAPGRNFRTLRWANLFTGITLILTWAFLREDASGTATGLRWLIGVIVASGCATAAWLRAVRQLAAAGTPAPDGGAR